MAVRPASRLASPAMDADLEDLLQRIEAATGADPALDGDIAALLADSVEAVPAYTASVDACLTLMHAVLPRWHWHLGHDASGVFPYASLSKGRRRVSAKGTTVPLVLLSAIVRALLSKKRR